MNVVSLGENLYFSNGKISAAVTENMDGTVLIENKAKALKKIIPFLESSDLNSWIRKCLEENDEEYVNVIEQFREIIIKHAKDKEFKFFLPDDIYTQIDAEKVSLNLYPIGSLIESSCTFPKTTKEMTVYEFISDNGTYFISKKNNNATAIVYISFECTQLQSPLQILKKVIDVSPNEDLSVKKVTLTAFLNSSIQSPVNDNESIIIKSSNEERFKQFAEKTRLPWKKTLSHILSEEWPDYSFSERVKLNNLLAQLNKKNTRMQALETIFDTFIVKGRKQLKVGVVSPFTYGKSTFVNSLIQAPLLEEDILVKTASITRIIYHDHFLLSSNEEKELILEKTNEFSLFQQQLSALTTNIDNQSLFATRAMLPHKGATKNIELVDTPGLFGPYPQHDQMTERYVEQLDVIVYMLDPLKAGFEPYTRKINELQDKYGKRCVFVMNKLDLVPKETDQELVVAELKNKILANFKNEPLFLVSSYFASRVRFYKAGLLTLDDLKRNEYIYAKENGEIISGRALNETHIDSIEELSGIKAFEKYLLQVKS